MDRLWEEVEGGGRRGLSRADRDRAGRWLVPCARADPHLRSRSLRSDKPARFSWPRELRPGGGFDADAGKHGARAFRLLLEHLGVGVQPAQQASFGRPGFQDRTLRRGDRVRHRVAPAGPQMPSPVRADTRRPGGCGAPRALDFRARAGRQLVGLVPYLENGSGLAIGLDTEVDQHRSTSRYCASLSRWLTSRTCRSGQRQPLPPASPERPRSDWSAGRR